MTTSTLAAIEEAFEAFDRAMDPVLDEIQAPGIQGAIAAGLAIRLVQYQLGQACPVEEAQKIALSLARELATLRRNMQSGQWDG